MSNGSRSRTGWYVLAAVCAFVAGSTLIVQLRRQTFRPPDDVATLPALARAGEPRKRLARVELLGKVFYVWLGRTVWLAAPSGPSCYVFDARGELVAFTATTGDLELSEYCDAAWQRPEITLDDALKEIAAGRFP